MKVTLINASTALLFSVLVSKFFLHELKDKIGHAIQTSWTWNHSVVFGGNEFLLSTVGTVILIVTCFWSLNGLLMLPDCFGWPKWILKYRVQPGENEPVDPLKLRKAIKVVLVNQILIHIPLQVLYYYLMRWRGCSLGAELPSFLTVILQLVICVLVEEIGFYYSHRLLHHPRLYKHIHKLHHEWTAPIGIVSTYSHPLEFIFSGSAPVLIGPLMCGSHLFTLWLWEILVIFGTTVHHCGYHLPYFPSPEFHDYHHLKFNQCFGLLGFLDRWHGTDRSYQASVQNKRHYTSFSAVPVNEQIPDKAG